MISERMDANQIKQIKITVRNNTPTAAADLKLKTNLKPDQFSAVIPKIDSAAGPGANSAKPERACII